MRDSLAEHFQESLIQREGPTFLSYQPGDFFLPHSDNDAGSAGSSRSVGRCSLHSTARAPSLAAATMRALSSLSTG